MSDVVVVNIDGTDADSGTAVEVGIAVESQRRKFIKTPKVICVRTDFRTDLEKEIGVNAMLQLANKVIYKPAFVNSFTEVETFYGELAEEIHKAIQELYQRGR